jgi:CRP/FNR family transcriptional regulator, nitrogen oxide reductase regulator
MPRDVRELLEGSNLFADVRLDTLDVALASAISRGVEEDAYFFFQGDPATHAYLVAEGRVKLLQVTPGGQQVIMRVLTAGESFAGIALLKPKAGYPVSAQAVEDSTALAWEAATLRALAESDPALALNTTRIITGYMTEVQDRYRELATEKVERRIARTLLRLASQSGRKVEEGVLIDIQLTRQDIAQMTGTTLFTVSRTLNEWERQGLLDIGRERVVITNPHGLVAIAEDLPARR